DAPLRFPTRSTRHRLLGTGFDYLLRFELSRLAPHAVDRGWVAEVGTAPNPLQFGLLRDEAREFARSHHEFNLQTIIHSVANDPSLGLDTDEFTIEYVEFTNAFKAVWSQANCAVTAELEPEQVFLYLCGRQVIEAAHKVVAHYLQ